MGYFFSSVQFLCPCILPIYLRKLAFGFIFSVAVLIGDKSLYDGRHH